MSNKASPTMGTILFSLLLVTLTTVHLTNGQMDLFPRSISPYLEELADQDVSYRLPNNTKPNAYDVSLTTNIHRGDFNFQGVVKIDITAVEDTKKITLHHRLLTIGKVTVVSDANPPIDHKAQRPTYNNKTELLDISVDTPLQKNKNYLVTIEFSGVLRDDESGFYRSYYTNKDGVRRWLGATQFESTDARHGFPCYDEPALKATFTIHITHDQSYSAISNMPETRKNNSDGTVTTSFEKSPKMSPYLVAYIVSDFPHLTSPKTKARTYAEPEYIDVTKLALDDGDNILEGLAKYVEIPFTLPKMDQAAIPQFAAGAMENWGLVTYRESAFFYNPNASTERQIEQIRSIIAHEYGHQWFGDLVSPKWWTWIWLNEGFANYFGNKGVDLVYPDMKMMELYVLNTVQGVLRGSDATLKTRPMTHYIEDPKSIQSVFDNIAYQKSGSVIRMFSHAFTEETFKKGLNLYLTEKQFSDAEESDLFKNLQKAVDADKIQLPANVSDIWVSWTQHKGFPVLHVTLHSDGKLELEQQHYLNDKSIKPNDNLWWIPYNFVTASDNSEQQNSNTIPDGWLSTKSTNLSSSDNRKWKADDWIVFNKQHAGYYRVQYDEKLYKSISDALNKNASILHTLTKSQLIDDLVNFVDTGRLKPDLFLSLIRFLKQETEYVPWATATYQLSQLRKQLSGTPKYNKFQKYVETLVSPLFNKTGINDLKDETHLEKYVRNLAIEWACLVRLDQCLDATNNKLKSLIANGTQFHQNVENTLYCASLRKADESQFNFVWRKQQAAVDQGTRNSLIDSLGCVGSKKLLDRYLASTLNTTNQEIAVYRSGEAIRVLNSIYSHGSYGLEQTIKFIGKNADEVNKVYDKNTVQRLVDGIADQISTHQLHGELHKTLNALGTSVNANQTLDIVTTNMKKNDEDLKIINKWLDENVSDGAGNVAVSMAVLLIASVFSVLNYF